jgi:hypothetical protein
MPPHRSISQRLSKARSPEARASLLQELVSDWRKDQIAVLAQFEDAIVGMNRHQLDVAFMQLKKLTEMRLPALVDRVLVLLPTADVDNVSTWRKAGEPDKEES